MDSDNSDPVTAVAEILEEDAERALAYGDEALQFNKGQKSPKAKKKTLMDRIPELVAKEPKLVPLVTVEFKHMNELKKSKKPAVKLIPSPSLELGAWTMSGSLVFVNPEQVSRYARAKGLSSDEVLINTLAHEALHVTDFKTGGRPKDHLEMLRFECDAYGSGSPACTKYNDVSDRMASSDPAVKLTGAQANDEIRDWFIKEKYLPTHKDVADLYEP